MRAVSDPATRLANFVQELAFKARRQPGISRDGLVKFSNSRSEQPELHWELAYFDKAKSNARASSSPLRKAARRSFASMAHT